MEDLKQTLLQESLTCIVSQDNILHKEHANGILPLLHFIDEHWLKHAIVVDKVIGKAAAMLMVYGHVKQVHAITISEHALAVFHQHNIPITYDNLVPFIINRNKDGMCPMEQTVLNCQSIEEAYQLLQEKVVEMTNRKTA